MEALLAIAIVAALLWWKYGRKKSEKNKDGDSAGHPPQVQDQRRPAPPVRRTSSGRPLVLANSRLQKYHDGEAHPTLYLLNWNQRDVWQIAQRLLPGYFDQSDTAVLHGYVEIKPEPRNSHDREAIRALLDGTTIGYFALENKAIVHRRYREAGRRGLVARVVILTSRRRTEIWVPNNPDIVPNYANHVAKLYGTAVFELPAETPDAPIIREHRPTLPDSEPALVWGRTAERIEVVGEFARAESYVALLGREVGFHSSAGADRDVQLQLAEDIGNPYDEYAVAVWCEGHHVGYIPRERAAEVSRILRRMGTSVSLPGRIWARNDRGEIRARATIQTPPLDRWQSAGMPPGDAEVVLPDGARMQVIGEENFMDTLGPLVPDEGEAMVWLCLKVDFDFRPNSAKKRVNVFLDEDQIGWLSDVQSANVLPIVQHINERGKVAVAKGVIAGSPLKAEVVLYVARAADVTRDWLDSHGEPTTAQSAKQREFEWDDDE